VFGVVTAFACRDTQDVRGRPRIAPQHISTLPGLAIMVTVLGFNFLGDGLRDALDPRL
jgi:ABC-type dipeptide/oligopeptide/nickel transport system permease subunit